MAVERTVSFWHCFISGAAGVPVESLGLAAKQDASRAREATERTGWRDDVGEEPQDTPDWEE